MRVKHFCTALDTSRPFRRNKGRRKTPKKQTAPPKGWFFVAFSCGMKQGKRGPVNLFWRCWISTCLFSRTIKKSASFFLSCFLTVFIKQCIIVILHNFSCKIWSKSMNNDKKEYPVNGLERDCISKRARQVLCYVGNIKGIKKYAKNQLNRRMRRYNKTVSKIQDNWFPPTLIFGLSTSSDWLPTVGLFREYYLSP